MLFRENANLNMQDLNSYEHFEVLLEGFSEPMPDVEER
jgi:hypothetical protein